MFDDNGRTVEVVGRVSCTILERPIRQPDDRVSVVPSGAPVWMTRPDGSILIVEWDTPCRWLAMPAEGETADLLVPEPNRFNAPMRVQGLLVDDGRRPTRASGLDIVQGSDGIRLMSFSATVIPDLEPDTSAFRAAFPAWREARSHAPDVPALMERDRWVFVWAFTRPLPDGACEGQASVVVHSDTDLPACAANDPFVDPTPMIATPDARFSQVDLAPRPANRVDPDRYPVSALRRARAPTLDVESGETWAPQACVPGLCASPRQVAEGAYMLDMEGRQVVSVSLGGNRLSTGFEARLR